MNKLILVSLSVDKRYKGKEVKSKMIIGLFLLITGICGMTINEYIDPWSPDWLDPNNWSLGHVPQGNETALIDNKIVMVYGENVDITNLWLRNNAIFSIYEIMNIKNELRNINSNFLVFANLSFDYWNSSNALLWIMNNSNIQAGNPIILNIEDQLVVGLNTTSDISVPIVNSGSIELLPQSKLKIPLLIQSKKGQLSFNIGSATDQIQLKNSYIQGILKLKPYSSRNISKPRCFPLILGQINLFQVEIKNYLSDFQYINVTKEQVSLCLT